MIQLADENSLPVESTFTLEKANLDPLSGPTIFPDNVVIEFDRIIASDIKFFQAVHLGDVILNIEPTDMSIPSVSVLIVINEPTTLGNSLNQLDASFVDFGHECGIPPQILKGLARRESGPTLNPTAYRYEPISTFGDLGVISGGQNLRTQEPYSLYRLATSDGLEKGTGIITEDISPRSIYFIKRNENLRHINDNDNLVSALEIFEQNDDFLGLKDPSVPNQRWSSYASQNFLNQIRSNKNVLNFAAQTPLAASYGLMQVLYTTAIAPLGWRGIKNSGVCRNDPEECNPSFLFDTSTNIARGGGTLALASEYLRRGFGSKNPKVSSSDPVFKNSMRLEEAYRRMLTVYNQRKAYPQEVLDFSRNFFPIPSTTIFQ